MRVLWKGELRSPPGPPQPNETSTGLSRQLSLDFLLVPCPHVVRLMGSMSYGCLIESFFKRACFSLSLSLSLFVSFLGRLVDVYVDTGILVQLCMMYIYIYMRR